jgi:hypothetical protein
MTAVFLACATSALATVPAGSASAAGSPGPPPLTVLTSGADNGNGDIFLAPYGSSTYASGPEIVTVAGQVVWFHPLISSRHTWTVYKVNRNTGQVIWELGGKQSSFTLQAAPGQVLDGAGEIFAWQHDPEGLGNGLYTVFDDESGLGLTAQAPLLPYSRAVTVHLDLQAHVATLVKSDDQPEGLVAAFGGNAQTTGNGDLFVNWDAQAYSPSSPRPARWYSTPNSRLASTPTAPTVSPGPRCRRNVNEEPSTPPSSSLGHPSGGNSSGGNRATTSRLTVSPSPNRRPGVETTQSKKAGPRISEIAREKKLQFFFGRIRRDAKVLDVGCADGWAQEWARGRGWADITGLDLMPPADVVGDIREWKNLGLEAHSFDAILAFEVLEHGDFAASLHDLLRPDGRLMATTPVPHMDWLCQVGEAAGLLQRRTSPHTHLVDLRQLPRFKAVEHHVKGLVSQWGVLRPV